MLIFPRVLLLFSMLALATGLAAAADMDPVGPEFSVLKDSIDGQNILAQVMPGPAVTEFPPPLDFKKQEIPKKNLMPPPAAAMPNFDPLIDQLIRHTELSSYANRLMPWVYTTTAESVVADFEEAATRLDFADECLQQAMRNAICENGSLEVDPMLRSATEEIDKAEFTIILLLEIAKLDL